MDYRQSALRELLKTLKKGAFLKVASAIDIRRSCYKPLLSTYLLLQLLMYNCTSLLYPVAVPVFCFNDPGTSRSLLPKTLRKFSAKKVAQFTQFKNGRNYF